MIGVAHSLAAPPAPGGSAIAVIDLHADDADSLDRALGVLGLGAVAVGQVRTASILGVDTGVVARWSACDASLMPHGSPLIVREIRARLEVLGLPPLSHPAHHPARRYPEAADLVEACTLDTLARAASPRAVDVLLRQPEEWSRPAATHDPAIDAMRNRLLTPPTVAVVGRPNVGKSTLTNALARRAVSIVTPEAGTTRDHVGVMLDLDGLLVRWIDTPGLRAAPQADDIERAAVDLARRIIAAADVVVLAGDAEHGFVTLADAGLPASATTLRVATRADQGLPAGPLDAITSAISGHGLDPLARLLRQTLVPDEALAARSPWRFHPALTPLARPVTPGP